MSWWISILNMFFSIKFLIYPQKFSTFIHSYIIIINLSSRLFCTYYCLKKITLSFWMISMRFLFDTGFLPLLNLCYQCLFRTEVNFNRFWITLLWWFQDRSSHWAFFRYDALASAAFTVAWRLNFLIIHQSQQFAVLRIKSGRIIIIGSLFFLQYFLEPSGNFLTYCRSAELAFNIFQRWPSILHLHYGRPPSLIKRDVLGCCGLTSYLLLKEFNN